MPLRPDRHHAVRRAVAPIARAALLTVLAVVLAACGADTDRSAGPAVTPAPAASGDTAPATRDEIVIVLPPADGLADAERVRLRMLVERATDEVMPGGPTPVLLEPATTDALGWTVEAAVRRVGTSGTVCLIGADGATAIAPILALYPAARACLLPAAARVEAARAVPPLTADVDLERLGRELGAAARAAAGEGTVLILSARDVMLDRRWLSGVVAGASGPVHTVASAGEALMFVDAQAARLADGVVPSGPPVLDGGAASPVVDPADLDDVPPTLALPTVSVVVLDASVEAAVLVGPLIERGLLVVGPRSLLAGLPDDAIVLRWRVRWDVSLVELLRRAGVGPGSAEGPPGIQPLFEDTVVLEPGRAHVVP